MKLLANLFFLFFFLQLNAQSWTQLADFPGVERDDGCSFTINNIAYCGSGVVPYHTLKDFYSFDMITEKWDTIASMPNGMQRQYATGFSDDSLGFGYVFGGYSGGFLNDLWQYNIQLNQWTKKASLPGVKRSGAASFIIGHLAYVIGGKTDSLAALNEVWVYNMIQDTWQQKRDFPFGSRWRSSATATDSLGYLIFGLDRGLNYQAGLFSYNPLQDKWTKVSDFPKGGRNYSSMQLIDNKLIVFGGEDSASYFHNDLWAFDLSSKKWEAMAPMPAKGRRGGICFHNKNTLFYTTGLAADKSRFIETWKWEQTTALNKNTLSTNINIYPNPTFSNITIESPYLHMQYSIYNMQGRLMAKGVLNNKRNRLAIGSYSNAIYLIHLKTQSESIVRKLVKQ